MKKVQKIRQLDSQVSPKSLVPQLKIHRGKLVSIDGSPVVLDLPEGLEVMVVEFKRSVRNADLYWHLERLLKTVNEARPGELMGEIGIRIFKKD